MCVSILSSFTVVIKTSSLLLPSLAGWHMIKTRSKTGKTGNSSGKSDICDYVELDKSSQINVCDINDGQQEMAILAPKTSMLPFSVVERSRSRPCTVSWSSAWS